MNDYLFRQIIDSCVESVLIVNSRHQIIYCNKEAEYLFEFNKSELVGRTIDDFFPSFLDVLDRHKNEDRIKLGNGLDFSVFNRKRKNIAVEISLTALGKDHESIYTLILSQIEKRKEKERKIQRFILKQEEINQYFVKAQLDLLKRQISPHFLFNCLSVLHNLIQENQEKSLSFIRKIKKIYGYVIEVSNKKLVGIKEEMNIMKSYFDIQRIRFDGKFVVKYSNFEYMNNEQIIPFSLQILIENIFKHNKVLSDKKFTIKVEKDEHYVTITNPIVIKYTKYKSHGIGLKNLIQQHKLISDKVPLIRVTESHFSVSIPIYKLEEYD